jgi:MFS family permease
MNDVSTNHKWWQGLTAYHWFVFAMASLAWLFDCLDQQIFILVRKDALKYLLPPGLDGSQIGVYSGYATSIFMVGWATGGLIFGSVGDWFGRAKTLTLTVLLYSVCTGLSAFSTGWIDFAIYRFITGMGVGGVFGLAVTLVADSLPAQARTGALGTLQALSAVGNISSGLIYLFIGRLVEGGTIAANMSWKVMFLVGALPAFLCVFLQLKLKEPEAWVRARQEGKANGVKFGSYTELLGDPTIRHRALFGMLLCVAGIIGVWGIGFFAPDLVRDVITNNLTEKGVPQEQVAAEAAKLVGRNGIYQNIGAFIGMISFTYLAQAIGRRLAFVLAAIAAMVATIFYFQTFNGAEDLWMSSVMGICQMALFAGFAIYLPELFPLRLRSTGTSFCYNVGRYVAATGPFTLGQLQSQLAEKAVLANPDSPTLARIGAFRDACTYMSAIFLLAIVAVAFLPETKGKPLPQ